MIEKIWDKNNEQSQFLQMSRDDKYLDSIEVVICPHKRSVWIGDKEKDSWDYELMIERILKNIIIDENVSNDENTKNKNVFENFLKNNLNNPRFKDRFVAIVNGEFQDVGDERSALIKKMYAKFGNVHMYVDKITDQKEIIHIHTPRFT